MMKFRFAEEPEYYPMQIYFVDKMPSTMLVAAKKFALPIIEPEPNNNVMLTSPLSHTIYVFNDFENHKMFPLVEKTPYTWILGPTALQEMSKKPELELREKPTYCTCMYPFVFYINCPENFPLMKRMVKLLKWMGGRFVTRPNIHTTHMITTSSLAKGYTYCYTFKVPILSPAWVEHCWKQRRIPYFDATSVMDGFKVMPFLDLYIAIRGFHSEDLKRVEVSATANGAVVVQPDDLRCTHLVLSRDIARHVNINDVPTHIPYVVDEGWFMSSLEQDQCASEDMYNIFSPKEIRQSAWAIMDGDEGSKSSKTEGSTLRQSAWAIMDGDEGSKSSKTEGSTLRQSAWAIMDGDEGSKSSKTEGSTLRQSAWAIMDGDEGSKSSKTEGSTLRQSAWAIMDGDEGSKSSKTEGSTLRQSAWAIMDGDEGSKSSKTEGSTLRQSAWAIMDGDEGSKSSKTEGSTLRQSAWAIMDGDEGSKSSKTEGSTLRASLNNKDQILFKAAKRETQNMKRKYAFEELHLKEKNYLHCLKQLLKIQQLATDAFQPGGTILSEAEAKIIFGNIGNLVAIHQELTDYFEHILLNWQNDAVTVQQVIMLKEELLKQYATYTSNYNESKTLMKICEIKNKRFRKLLVNSMKTTNKEHPKDIFIRPIQRLCSLVLQLQEINRNTRQDNPDKEVLNEAILAIKDVLEKINNSEELVEKLKCIFDIHRRIKNCPPDLITCHREFIIQFSAQEVVSDKHFERQRGIQVMLFLFNDIIEITKIRIKSQAARKNHCTLDSLNKKPFEHIASLPLSMVINVIEFEGKEDNDLKVFGLNIKDTKEEGNTFIHCFQYSGEDHHELKDILMLIAEQLAQRDSSKSPKDFISTSVPITRICIVPIVTKSDGKALDKVWDLFKVPSYNKKTDTKGVVRKSLSCSDLIDPSNVL